MRQDSDGSRIIGNIQLAHKYAMMRRRLTCIAAVTASGFRDGRKRDGLGLTAAAIAIVAALAGPQIGALFTVPVSPLGAPVTISAPFKPSVLILINDSVSLDRQAQLTGLLTATARPKELLLALSPDGGSLYSGSAPTPSAMIAPQPPAPLPVGATALQRARFEQATAEYDAKLEAAREALRRKRQQALAAWAADAVSAVSVRSTSTDLTAALSAAALAVTSLGQAGVADSGAAVVVIFGSGQQLTTTPTRLPAGLNGSTVIASGFSGSKDYEAAWQADLMESGAANAVSLSTTDGDSQLASIVRTALGGTPRGALVNISFAQGQSGLSDAATAQLYQLLALLRSNYPQAPITINGYADDLLMSQESLSLSQQRAKAVSDWLTANGVAVGQVKIVGHGDSDLIPLNSTHGKPLNRGVVVIVQPFSALHSTSLDSSACPWDRRCRR